jgi:Fic family protein
MSSVETYIEQYQKLNLDQVVNYDKFNEFAITTHSTQIEGSTLTAEDTALLIDEGITPKGKPLEHSLMVKDHHQALKQAIAFGIQKKSISIDSICQLNAAAMKSTGQQYNTALGNVDASKGEIRKDSVLVQKRYFPAYNKVPDLLKELCTQLNKKMKDDLSIREQITLSYSAHFNLVSIHPHYDGNGRTARLLMNQIQKTFNLPLSIVFQEDKLDYYKALENSRKQDSIEPIKEFMDSQYIKYLLEEMNRYQKQNKENKISFLL